MDTETFWDYCEKLEKGLHKLADDLYASIEENISSSETLNLVNRAKEKVALYNEVHSKIDNDDTQEEELLSIGRYIDRLTRNIKRYEASL